MSFSIRYWLRLSIISFLVVAALGLLMRYKIPFSLPLFHQKHLLHAHSHFAFTGWITQTLFVLMIHFLIRQGSDRWKKYRFILIANLICCYGMLIAFTMQGYGAVSITFSTLSVFVFYLFCIWYYKDLSKTPAHPSKNWFRASLFFGVLSTVGTFYLAYMMYSKSVNQDHYLGSLYFFLHFQYNGWFLFASMGLLIMWLREKLPALQIKPVVFRLFFWACIPAYLLSILWAKLPLWLLVITALAAIAQFAGFGIFLAQLRKVWHQLASKVNRLGGIILVFAGFAFAIKLFLQLGSTVPSVSKLAFGFRPIVIAYLHLILLGVFSLYLISYSYLNGFLRHNKATVWGLAIIVTGVFLNEFVLLVQGLAGFSYTPVPYVNEILLAVASIIFMGAALLLVSQFKKEAGQIAADTA